MTPLQQAVARLRKVAAVPSNDPWECDACGKTCCECPYIALEALPALLDAVEALERLSDYAVEHRVDCAIGVSVDLACDCGMEWSKVLTRKALDAVAALGGGA